MPSANSSAVVTGSAITPDSTHARTAVTMFSSMKHMIDNWSSKASQVWRPMIISRSTGYAAPDTPLPAHRAMPDLSTYAERSSTESVIFPHVVVPGLTPKAYTCHMSEMARILCALVKAKRPAIADSVGDTDLRQVSMCITAVRAGMYWFLNAYPPAYDETTSKMYDVVGADLRQNASGRRMSATEEIIAMERFKTPIMYSMEWNAMKLMYKAAPVIVRLSMLAMTQQLSASALSSEVTSLHSQVKKLVGRWPSASIGIKDRAIFELVVLSCTSGMPNEYMLQLCTMPVFDAAIGCTSVHSEEARMRSTEMLAHALDEMDEYSTPTAESLEYDASDDGTIPVATEVQPSFGMNVPIEGVRPAIMSTAESDAIRKIMHPMLALPDRPSSSTDNTGGQTPPKTFQVGESS